MTPRDIGGRSVAFRILLLSLLSVITLTYAEPADEKAVVPNTRMILEAGEIDSNTVKVGAFAVVIYWERDPVSEEWESPVTSRGYVRSVDAETLILAMGRDRRTKRVALDRIQTLVLIGQPSLEWTNKDSSAVTLAAEAAAVVEPAPSMAAEDSVKATASRGLVTSYSQRSRWLEDRNKRLAVKCGTGAYMGPLSAVAGFLIFLRYVECVDPDGGQEPILFCNKIVGLPVQVGQIGHVIGTALGVTLADPYDRFTYLYALGGTWVGRGAARELVTRLPDKAGWGWVALGSYVALPAVMAALASEGMRGFHEEPRFSVGLTPDRRGSMAAVATLRF